MKKIFKFILIGTTVAVIAPACSIEKRVHNPGYHVTWNSLKSTTNGGEMREETPIEKNYTSATVSKLQTNAAKSIQDNSTVTPEVKSNSKVAEKMQQVADRNTATVALVTPQKIENQHELKAIAKVTAEKKAASNTPANDTDDELILLYLLAILIPFVAVGIVTDWDLTDVVINLLLCLLCYIPGVIHAFIKIRDNR